MVDYPLYGEDEYGCGVECMNMHAIEKGAYSPLYLFISFISFIHEVGQGSIGQG